MVAACAYCGDETELYSNGVPICIKCSNERENKPRKGPSISGQSIRSVLVDNIAEATARANKASQNFMEVMGKIPSGFPHPDGTQHIHNVSRELATARKDLMRAHAALDDFLKTGVVPDDLKRSGQRLNSGARLPCHNGGASILEPRRIRKCQALLFPRGGMRAEVPVNSCLDCGAATELYDRDVPMCPECSAKRDRERDAANPFNKPDPKIPNNTKI